MELLIALVLALLLFVAVFFSELPGSLAPAATCFSIPRRLILPVMLLSLGVGLFIGGRVPDVQALVLDVSTASVPVALGSSLLVVIGLRLLGQRSAFIPSLSAALIGTQLYGGVMDSSLLWVPAQWLASMVVALVLGLLCTKIGRAHV